MWSINLLKFSLKQLRRHWVRSLLTLFGTACGMSLFLTVETFQQGLKNATELQAGDDTLIVYREKRFCPFASRLPEDYAGKIAQIPGVKSVTPLKVVVNNCSTSLDTVTFRGIPTDDIADFLQHTNLTASEIALWQKQKNGALIGKELAARRRLQPGVQFDAAGITVQVVGIIESDNPQDKNSAYVQLDFLQKASRRGLGEVTQFNVKVTDYQKLAEVAGAIDSQFKTDRAPTSTRPEKAFIAQTAKDMVQLIAFTRWMGIAAVIAVICLVTNTVIIAVRGRIRENAVMQTLGFQSEHLAWMTLTEGIILGTAGGFLGISVSAWFMSANQIALSAEGVSLVFNVTQKLFLQALCISVIIGFISGVYPAFLSAKGKLTLRLRSV